MLEAFMPFVVYFIKLNYTHRGWISSKLFTKKRATGVYSSTDQGKYPLNARL